MGKERCTENLPWDVSGTKVLEGRASDFAKLELLRVD